ncbi:Saccharopine dehydrogenase-domain-containing protein [Crucibulum laeve]|uniref:Saccharopine dehydrogenase-domain-containing protein n=1 Tax=Crucibulum laeve TaxID=68775 RepID=A0A5C3MIJ6_9AGAR|nr:Saccharopine dehydrogenase-domain-containing protein [Crucibulum laeve]
MTPNPSSDILVLGATGFTGRLITRYLTAHPQHGQFTLALGARSNSKLQQLVKELGITDNVRLVEVDVTQPAQVEEVVKTTRVVINTVGPYWTWGTPVVEACIRHGIHYVDLTGETVWIRELILKYDYYATKTGSIIVPSCGMDSIPSDISAFLSNKTLKAHSENLALTNPALKSQPLLAGTSTTGHKYKGGISGGTMSTILVVLGKVPRDKLKDAMRPYSTSPAIGPTPAQPKFLYKLPIPDAKTLIGGYFIMQSTNRALVQRTYGLLEVQAQTDKSHRAQLERYGPQFNYDEFMVMPSAPIAIGITAAIFIGTVMLALIKPIRILAQNILAKSGSGPSDEEMKHGSLLSTNITTSSSANGANQVQVKTVIKGKGDPGYLLTAVMISESALCLILPPVSSTTSPSSNLATSSPLLASPSSNPSSSLSRHAKPTYDPLSVLPALARQGGVLTPMTAFGDVLVKRLEETGRFEFGSWVVGQERKSE